MIIEESWIFSRLIKMKLSIIFVRKIIYVRTVKFVFKDQSRIADISNICFQEPSWDCGGMDHQRIVEDCQIPGFFKD